MRTRLHTVSATSGFLEQCPVEFAPGLTCIIGARGTCKSTLIESIRFTFDADQDRVKSLVGTGSTPGDPTFGLIRATLGPGSVRCEVISETDTRETRQVFEREVEGDTRIFQDGVREHSQRELLHSIEIFSQSDLQRIADDGSDDLRLALIDRPNKVAIARLIAENTTAAAVLRRVGPELRGLRGNIAQFRQELQPYRELKQELRNAREAGPALPPELESEHALYERRTKILDSVNELEALRREAAEQLQIASQLSGKMETVRSRLVSEAAGKTEEPVSPTIDVDRGALEKALCLRATGGKLLIQLMNQDRQLYWQLDQVRGLLSSNNLHAWASDLGFEHHYFEHSHWVPLPQLVVDS